MGVPLSTASESLSDTSSLSNSQFSEFTSGSIDSDWSLPLPLPSPDGQILERPNLKVFSFEDLRSATKNFSPDTWLGEGDFGQVYKGWLDENTLSPTNHGSGMVVAVKNLYFSFLGFEPWQTDIEFLGRLSHPNLIKLLGYCRQDEKLLLVYEFMLEGSLENHLFRKPNWVPLSWTTRLRIAIDVARGLTFLHTFENPVIHRGLKTSDILLDRNYKAKISDFGVADLIPWGPQTDFYTTVAVWVWGPFSYAEERVATGRLYVKSDDVYGFGEVLLEILTGMRVFDRNKPKGQQKLVEWIKPFLSSAKKIKLVMDPKMAGQYSLKAALQVAKLTLKCLVDHHKQRPSMKEVLEALEVVEGIQNRNFHGLTSFFGRVVRVK